MTRVNVLKFSVALSAAAATHLSVLAYTVSYAPPPLVAGSGFSVQFGSLASATNAGSLESMGPEATDPAPPEQEQPLADHAPPEPKPPVETIGTEPAQPTEPVSVPAVKEKSPPPPKPDASPEYAPQAESAPVTQESLPASERAPQAHRGISTESIEQAPDKGGPHSEIDPHAASESPTAEPSNLATSSSAQPAATGNSEYSNYSGKVMKHLSRLRRPRASGPGSAHIRFVIASRGTIEHIEVSQSSGSSRFDREALIFVKKASPFPPPPTGISRSFTVEIEGT
ncbi:TonB family protein [Hyphomonas sp.]|jgi:protein TonB|uniref:TonB family protein n=1 Tax=Hyphomonas sp. TaxID=87 RepID=UPI0032D94641